MRIKCLKVCLFVLLMAASLMLFLLPLRMHKHSNPLKEMPAPVHMDFKNSNANGNSSLEMFDGRYAYKINLHQYAMEFPYMQGYQCHLEQDKPDLCRMSAQPPLLLLAVKTHPGSFIRREALRVTWANNGKLSGFMVKHVFLMAQAPDPAHMQQVAEEDAEYKDILLWDFEESHHNLSLKVRCFIGWLRHNCKEVDFILNVDDDEYVNLQAMVKYLEETVDASRAVHGYIHNDSDSEREGKYKITETMYPSAKYPIFPAGGGYIVPGTFIEALYNASVWMPVFPLEDVYFGLLGSAAKVAYQHYYQFRVAGMTYSRCAYKEALVVHGIKPQKMIHIWSDVRNEDPPCGQMTF